jgi:hypothetical protein
MESVQYGCSVIAIIISMVILEYVLRLEREDCECSKDWRRDYIKIFAIATIVFVLLMCFRNFLLPRGLKVPRAVGALLYLVATMYMIGAFVNVYAMFSYSQKLIIKKNCKCANTWTRDFIYYYSMIIGVTYLIVIIASVVLAIISRTNPNIISNLRTNIKNLKKKDTSIEKNIKANVSVDNNNLRKDASVAGKYIKKGVKGAKRLAARGSRAARRVFKAGVKSAKIGVKNANVNVNNVNSNVNGNIKRLNKTV